MNFSIARAAGLLATAGLALPAVPVFAQCTSGWSTVIGVPGLGSGYVAPMHAFNDGAGEEIYVGGSFGSAGGNTAAAYLARYNPATQAWSPVGGGIQSNNTTFLTSIVTADLGNGPTLFIGGAWGSAGNLPDSRNVAGYRNGQFFSLNGGWQLSTADSVWALAAWNDGTGMKLYVGGGFPMVAGSIQANGIAAWDGANWSALGSGITHAANPTVFALKVFDDGSGPALYAAGRFTSVGGVPGTSLIGRWNGTNWSSVGGGLTGTSGNFGIEAMEIYNDGSGDALYVGGLAFTPPGQPTGIVAKWNGASWTTIGQTMTGRVTSMAKFNDGTGETLYIGGTMTPVGRIARLENNQWVMVDGGVDASVFGLRTIGDRLYVGGSFQNVNGQPSNRIATRTSCQTPCYANCDSSTTEPVLNVADFSCFLGKFAAGAPYANCDGSTQEPVLNVADFSCFLGKFAAGCR